MFARTARLGALGVLTALGAACDNGSLEPDPTSLSPSFTLTNPVCETITFNSFTHGAQINTLTLFGLPLTVTTTAGDPPSANQAVAFNTNNTTHPDFDLRWSGTGATCSACAGLGRIAVILDSRGFAAHGDSDGGGNIEITGFAGNGDFSLVRFKAIDQEPPPDETSINGYVDGVLVGSSTGQGDGSVETVTASANTFTTSLRFELDGSGGVDDIRVCREREEEGGEGCTPGYWKQEQHFDSWPDPYDPTDLFDDHFENAFPGQTLLQVLKGQGGGLIALGRHTVAALLNSASSGVSFELTPGEVVNAFNAVFPGSDSEYETLKNRFAGLNQRLCPLN
jgi:hypothetical protein